MRSQVLVFTFLLSSFFFFSCKTKSAVVETKVVGKLEKIDFDLDALDKDGLIGPSDGKVSVDFQFCFPQGEDYEKQILAIDPEIKFFTNPRVCSGDQTIAAGNTHKPGHKEILRRLSDLGFVKKISRVWFE